jgi:hypothetical protein
MYPEQFDDFKEEFLNDPEVENLLSTIRQRFEDGYKNISSTNWIKRKFTTD